MDEVMVVHGRLFQQKRRCAFEGATTPQRCVRFPKDPRKAKLCGAQQTPGLLPWKCGLPKRKDLVRESIRFSSKGVVLWVKSWWL